MPVQFVQKNEGLGDLARTLVSAPGIIQQNRQRAQQAALGRASEAANLRESLANARKSQAETSLLGDQFQARQDLGENLNTLSAFQNDRTVRVPPPAEGSADSPLEADINEMLRGNQDLFPRRDVPSASDAQESLAQVLRGFGGNAAQVTDAMGNVQSQGFSAEAAGQARAEQQGDQLIATLNDIAAGNQIEPAFETNAQGTVLNQFSGDLNESGQLAQANIASEQALAADRNEPTLTPQDKTFDALVNLNQALAREGKPTMSESMMRAVAAGTLDTRQSPTGLSTMVIDPARQVVVGTFDERNGFQAFERDTGGGDEGPGFFGSMMNLFTGGGNETTADDQATAGGGEPPATAPRESVWSPVLERNVTEAEIARTADNRGISEQQVRERLGIQ